ncbi:DUF1372 family protein [Streptococcus suis]|uniref:DUF1372 family protein n=1 Tax=Streptococcus suis TaxID=1307 RepID=UPI0006964F7A|nr:DUF1372 family protein [Streptococcus suis]NQF64721.1 DUF1372 family protein [Streptococcus suis]CYW29757.1 phage protein [Streptococcus suis]
MRKEGLIIIALSFALIVSLIEVHSMRSKIDNLESREPVIIYQVDNAGTEMFGKVTAKDVLESRYYVEVKPYGKFLVTREQYEEFEEVRDGHEAMFYPLDGEHRLIPWSRYSMYEYLPKKEVNG